MNNHSLGPGELLEPLFALSLDWSERIAIYDKILKVLPSGDPRHQDYKRKRDSLESYRNELNAALREALRIQDELFGEEEEPDPETSPHPLNSDRPLVWVARGTQNAMCRNPECNHIMELGAEVKHIPLKDLICPRCKWALSNEPLRGFMADDRR